MIDSKGDLTFKIISHIAMILASILVMIPLLLLVISSFTANDMILANGYSFTPEKTSLASYTYVLKGNNKILNSYGVSMLLTITGTCIGTIITVMLGYMLSRKDLPGRKVLTFLVFFTMLFNGGLVPTYMNYTQVFGIKNTFFALLIPTLLLNAFYVMLVKSFFITSIPEEIIEASRIDGASEYGTFFRIAAPMARPMIATIALFIGLGYWNDWYNGYLYITSRTELYSIQNLLTRMQQNIQFLMQNSGGLTNISVGLSDIPSEGIRMSMAVLGILPIVIIYPFVQNHFVQGITMGGVKG